MLGSLRTSAGKPAKLGLGAAVLASAVAVSVVLTQPKHVNHASGEGKPRTTALYASQLAGRPQPAPTASTQRQLAAYESQILGVIVVVNAAEKNMTAALQMAKSRPRLKEARADVEAALGDLRYARKQLDSAKPPASMTSIHRAVKSAIGLLIDGCTDVLHGIDTLNTPESHRGVRTFNRGLTDLRRATRLLQSH